MSDAVTDIALLAAMHGLLSECGADKSICPSEVPRKLLGNQGEWRSHLKRTRALAALLMATDQVLVLKKGKPVDAAGMRGVLRLRQGAAFPKDTFLLAETDEDQSKSSSN